jgi:catechol 2,3-dioxygenase-like lactoylglutathione lyase family enzyme
MNQHVHIVTLGVKNLQTSTKFYAETLGWKPASASNDGIKFFQAGGVVLALFPREELAQDATVPSEGSGFAGFTLAYNTRSEAEVDEIIANLKAQDVRILKDPQKVSWGGYSAYFADPDGNCWEVAFNPFFPFDDRGNLKLE